MKLTNAQLDKYEFDCFQKVNVGPDDKTRRYFYFYFISWEGGNLVKSHII